MSRGADRAAPGRPVPPDSLVGLHRAGLLRLPLGPTTSGRPATGLRLPRAAERSPCTSHVSATFLGPPQTHALLRSRLRFRLVDLPEDSGTAPQRPTARDTKLTLPRFAARPGSRSRAPCTRGHACAVRLARYVRVTERAPLRRLEPPIMGVGPGASGRVRSPGRRGAPVREPRHDRPPRESCS